MASAHIMPGYHDPVSRFRLVQSAYPLDARRARGASLSPTVPVESLESIKERARYEWSKPDRSPTTYNSFHNEKISDEPTSSRPTSAHRRNNPHPPLVFLTCRLHHVPGYHNADATLGKEVYRVDGSAGLSPREKQHRSQFRAKFTPKTSTAALRQYTDREQLEELLPPREAQAAEAWLKLTNDKDKRRVLDMFNGIGIEKKIQDGVIDPELDTRHAPMVASLHRYLKKAGIQEEQTIRRIMDSLGTNPNLPNMMIPYQTLGEKGPRRQEDIAKTRRVTYRYKPTRGDFLMHPDWPPTLAPHSLPDWPNPKMPPTTTIPAPLWNW